MPDSIPKSDHSIRRPTVVRCHQELKSRIIRGDYQPHSYIPSERQLAEDLGTSRVTVAKALELLTEDGLVHRTPGRGSRVLPLQERQDRPRIGIIHNELTAMGTVELFDSLRTLEGVRSTLDRLSCSYDLVNATTPDAVTEHRLTDRFGALLFVEAAPEVLDMLISLEQRRFELVVAKMEFDIDLCATTTDHRQPMSKAVQTLVGMGHRRIAFIGRDPAYAIHGPAREGYLAGIREAGIPFDEELVVNCDQTNAISGYFGARSLLKTPNPPTAFVAARDTIAEGITHAVKEANLAIGHDVSVIGFDDTTWPEGREILSTFREACFEMGVVAAEMLVDKIVSGWSSPQRREFETPFLLRRSAGPVVG